MSQLQKITDIAGQLGVSVRTVYRLPGFPSPIRFGRLVRWRAEDVAAWIEKQQTVAGRRGRPRSTREGV